MKIIHLTDTHLLETQGDNLYGLNPAYRLKRALKSIGRLHKDADCIVITGDLVNEPSIKAYRVLQELLEESKIPVYLLVGNHDSRQQFGKHFPDFIQDGFVQYEAEIDGRILLFLDTLVEGESYGMLCDERILWLKKRLKKHKKKDVLLFMHHHPVESGLYEMDSNANFRTKDAFWDLLVEYDCVKHIAFGHLHRIMHATYKGIATHSTRSTTFQVSYQPHSNSEHLTNQEKATYAIIEINKHGTIRIHHHEYLNEKMYYKDESRFSG
ncbi:MAG: phosphodiesterase [Sulfurovum sp.]|nr:phosphodiesterase [Sulfurovum sp.]